MSAIDYIMPAFLLGLILAVIADRISQKDDSREVRQFIRLVIDALQRVRR